MVKPFSEEIKKQWEEDILKQRESGLSIPRWCQENNKLKHNFYYWQNKLSIKAILDRSAFVELADGKRDSISNLKESGVSIEIQGILIRLDRQFDPFTLKQCLLVLKDVPC